ncbi:hypothetical protein [Jidongwangia harbinensis]|uniref:hypothetical protein n=1 Tax=Jidongwangia harbinensis TaxID=2878561 RepID=UPI001CDA499C|nr:hypothetical protein [Jidongwangia harbinensis]MCA2213461.1 hypothetical protein [Jidongwangia harbinensis]
MRLPTFSRQSGPDNTDQERPTVAVRDRNPGAHSVAAPNDATTTRFTSAGGAAAERASAGRAAAHAERAAAPAPAPAHRAATDRTEVERAAAHRDTDRTEELATVDQDRVPAGPKPRASLLATLGLVLAVAAALLVLSGPLLGYGIGVAGLALVVSLAGLRATRRRHIAGKTDALIGTVLAIAAGTVGVLALMGMLTWLGTDMQPVNTLREWLDAQFVDRF